MRAKHDVTLRRTSNANRVPFAAFAAAFVLAGCAVGGAKLTGPGDAPQTPPVAAASVSLTAPTTQLTTATSLPLHAVALDASGDTLSGASFTWSSSNTNVATVSSDGVVSGQQARHRLHNRVERFGHFERCRDDGDRVLRKSRWRRHVSRYSRRDGAVVLARTAADDAGSSRRLRCSGQRPARIRFHVGVEQYLRRNGVEHGTDHGATGRKHEDHRGDGLNIVAGCFGHGHTVARATHQLGSLHRGRNTLVRSRN